MAPSSTTATTGNSSSNHHKRQFTRNTPASSALALDGRFHSSRAIVCVAGNLAFRALTPAHENDDEDVLDVPQNPKKTATDSNNNDNDTSNTNNSGAAEQHTAVNMGAVLLEAKALSERTVAVAENAVRRAARRSQYRKAGARQQQQESSSDDQCCCLPVENPFSFAAQQAQPVSDDDDDASSTTAVSYQPNADALTHAWQSTCLPRFLQVLQTGAGHAVYHDLQWSTRHGRVAHLLRSLSSSGSNGDDDQAAFGPHLIVCTEPNVDRFAREFRNDLQRHLRLIVRSNNNDDDDSPSLQALVYRGSQRRRRQLREYFPQATGLPEAPFHVLITSYESFLEDYLHFCQLPFETVILDEGVSWMAVKESSGSLGSVFESALFSANDNHVGLAGTTFKEWDYSKDEFPEATLKEAWIGLTTRHRILTASSFVLELRMATELVPVAGLVDFVAPQFAAVAKEEWDRCKITTDVESMHHFRKLVARSVVVHHAEAAPSQDLYGLAYQALTGNLLAEPVLSEDPVVPKVIQDEDFVTSGKVAFSRRSFLQWLGPVSTSWLRYELGRANLEPILEATKTSNHFGYLCEEVTTASSTTASGATGQVAGTMAYRLAVRCGRHFGSEPGLRQHIAAHHAPAGTWLCRTCSSDCITSQARTHHERSCGQPVNGKLDSFQWVGGLSYRLPITPVH